MQITYKFRQYLAAKYLVLLNLWLQAEKNLNKINFAKMLYKKFEIINIKYIQKKILGLLF